MGSSGGGSGGGSSGKVDYPGYIKNVHEHWLVKGVGANMTELGDMNVTMAMREMWDNSPYTIIAAYDPTDELAAMTDRSVDHQELVDAFIPSIDWATGITLSSAQADSVVESGAVAAGFDPINDWEALAAAAQEFTDSNLVSSEQVDTAVSNFEARQATALQRNIARFASGMADINAVNSSSFAMGIAYITAQHQKEVAKFNAEAGLENYRLRAGILQASLDGLMKLQIEKNEASLEAKREKARFIEQEAARLAQMLQMKLDSDHRSSSLLTEVQRMKIVASKEYQDMEADYMVKDHMWNISFWADGIGVMSAISGASPIPSGKPKGAGGSALGGALSGAASGAMIGTAINPGLGTAIGAGIGAIGGAFMAG